MKYKCVMCKRVLDESRFYKRRWNIARVSSYCRECSTKNIQSRRMRNKIALIRYAGGKCKICGYAKNYSAMAFHHIDDDKEYNLSHHMDCSLKRLKKEADKCDLLCSNCHQEVHHPNALFH